MANMVAGLELSQPAASPIQQLEILRSVAHGNCTFLQGRIHSKVSKAHVVHISTKEHSTVSGRDMIMASIALLAFDSATGVLHVFGHKAHWVL
jgi:hypothetical protein